MGGSGGDWVNPRDDLDVFEKGGVSCPYRVFQSLTYSLYRHPAPGLALKESTPSVLIFATFHFQTADKMVLNTVNWEISKRVYSGTFAQSLIKTSLVSTAVLVVKSRNESQTISTLRDPKEEFSLSKS